MPFKKGQSGNPGGRPKKWNIKDYIQDNDVEKLIQLAKSKAFKNQTNMLKWLLEQVFGKAPQSMDVTSGGEKLKNDYDDFTDQELLELIRQARSKRGTSEERTGEETP